MEGIQGSAPDTAKRPADEVWCGGESPALLRPFGLSVYDSTSRDRGPTWLPRDRVLGWLGRGPCLLAGLGWAPPAAPAAPSGCI